MAITTYSELQTAVGDFLNRDDLTTVQTTFIDLAEADFNRRIRHWRMEKRSTATFDSQYESLPSDFLEAIRINIQTERQIELASVAEIIEKRRQFNNTAGEPRLYAMTAGEIELWPTPDASYTGEIVYYSRIEALSDSNTSNWLLSYHPDVYLYGTLVHSAPYLKDDPRLQIWRALLEGALAGLAGEDRDYRHGGTGLRLRRRGMS